MSLDFVAIDFETANYFRGSACSVGLAHVENGVVVSTRSQLIYQDEFADFHVGLHGITPDDVAGAPTFAEVWPDILDSIGELPVVAHNAAFDTGVIRDALVDCDMAWPNLTYACTLALSRRTYDLPSYRLTFVADAAGIPFDSGQHHRADKDAELAALVMLEIARVHGVDNLEDLRRKLGTGSRWSSQSMPMQTQETLCTGLALASPALLAACSGMTLRQLSRRSGASL